MNKTPWTKGPSSLPSDRLRPKNTPPPPKPPAKSNKQPAAPEISKSKQVKDLEELISNLESLTHPTRDPKGGCFCLAREHQLSPYNPLCTSCGLILCTLNKPHHTCPHHPCSQPLHTPGQRSSVLDELRTSLSSTLAKEQLARENLIVQAKKAAGAFPTLSSSTPPPPPQAPTPLRPSQETHKVLSLTSTKSHKGGRKPVTVTSYTTTPIPSLPVSRTETPIPEDIRVPPPPTTVDHAATRRADSVARPWQNFALQDSGGGVKYVPAPALVPTAAEAEGSNTAKSRSARRRANQRAKTDENAPAGSKHTPES